MIYRTFSDIDLYCLQTIQQQIESGKRIDAIDPHTILANYRGHTIFSIFFDRI